MAARELEHEVSAVGCVEHDRRDRSRRGQRHLKPGGDLIDHVVTRDQIARSKQACDPNAAVARCFLALPPLLYCRYAHADHPRDVTPRESEVSQPREHRRHTGLAAFGCRRAPLVLVGALVKVVDIVVERAGDAPDSANLCREARWCQSCLRQIPSERGVARSGARPQRRLHGGVPHQRVSHFATLPLVVDR